MYHLLSSLCTKEATATGLQIGVYSVQRCKVHPQVAGQIVSSAIELGYPQEKLKPSQRVEHQTVRCAALSSLCLLTVQQQLS